MADKNHTFLGNKNKTESFDGDAMDANLLQVSPINGNENHGDVIDIMDTVNLDQALFQNCSVNKFNDLGHVQNLSCDTVDTKGIQTEFDFIPKGPLRLYDGDPGVCIISLI